MTELLHELSRWRTPRAPLPRQNRWSAWSQALGDRYRRVPFRHETLAMTMTAPAVAAYAHCQRWTQSVMNYSPRIHLAISPLLQQTVWRTAPVPRQPAATTQMTQPAFLLQRAPAREHRDGQHAAQELHPESSAPAAGAGHRAPLNMVFARANPEAMAELLAPAARALAPEAVKDQVQMADRISSGRKRVEEPAPPPLMATRGPQPPAPATAAAFTESDAVVTQSARGPRVGMSGMAQPGAPFVDIERLTDQVVRNIDHRIVAQRERMGRAF